MVTCYNSENKEVRCRNSARAVIDNDKYRNFLEEEFIKKEEKDILYRIRQDLLCW